MVKSENHFRNLGIVESSVSAFDGDNTIKFRLIVTENLSNDEASKLFNEVLDTMASYSNISNLWDYYNVILDIKGYENNIFFEATKTPGKTLEVKSVN